MAIIAMTTNSSIKVKPPAGRPGLLLIQVVSMGAVPPEVN
jgi:hypothetical protein